MPLGDFTGRRPALPPGIPQIARRHPLAAGLAFLAWTPAPGVMLDLVSGVLGTATAPTPGIGAFGPQTSFLGSTSWISWPWPSLPTSSAIAAGGTGDFTVAALAAPAGSAPNSASLFQFGGTSNYARLQLNTTYTGASSTGIFSMQTYSGTSAGANSNGGVNGALALFLGRRQGGGDAVFLNGAPATLSGATGDANAVYNPGGPSAGTYIGNLPNTGYECLCPVVWVAAWNRALADTEIAAWFGNAGNAEPLGHSGLLQWPGLPVRSLPALNLTVDRSAPLESAASYTGREAQVEFTANTAADAPPPVELLGTGSSIAAAADLPIEAGLTAAVDDVLAEWLGSASGPLGDDWSTDFGQDFGGGAGAGGPPLETLSALAADRPAPAESAARALADRIAPAESAARAVVDRTAPAESTASPAADAMLPAEEHGATIAQLDQGVPVEAAASVAAAAFPPVEWVGSTPFIVLTADWLEWLATASRDGSLAEWLGHIIADPPARLEATAALQADRPAAAENTALYAAYNAPPAEAGAGLARVEVPPAEALVTARRDGAAAEWLLLARNDAGLVEAVGFVRADPLPPMATGASLAVDRALPAEAAGSLLGARLGLVEAIAASSRAGLPLEWAALFGGAPFAVLELTALGRADRLALVEALRSQAFDPVSNSYLQLEALMTMPPAVPFVAPGRLRRGGRRAFLPLAPGASDNFAFDFTAEAGTAAIAAVSWTCRLLPYQTIADAAPQSHILAQSAQTQIATDAPQYFPGNATPPPAVTLNGAFAVAIVGAFPPSAAGGLYELEATVATTDGRMLAKSAALPIAAGARGGGLAVIADLPTPLESN